VCASYANKIRYYHQDNQGVSVARNQGVALAGGEVIVFLDADDILAPNAVANLADPLWKDSSLGGCHGIVLMQGSADADFYRPPIGLFESGRIELFTRSVSHPISTASGVAVRKSAFLDVGGFTPGMRFGEDTELWNKIQGKYSWYFVSELVATYCRSIETSVTCQTPFHQHGLDHLWTERDMKERVRPELWESYRNYKAIWLRARARLALREGIRAYGIEVVEKMDVIPLNCRNVAWKVFYYLPGPAWHLFRKILIILRAT
jgi:glycosyltransferase involved in cell wall biosynthesis